LHIWRESQKAFLEVKNAIISIYLILWGLSDFWSIPEGYLILWLLPVFNLILWPLQGVYLI